MSTSIGILHLHIGDGDVTWGHTQSEILAMLRSAMTHAVPQSKDHALVRDLEDGTVRILINGMTVYAHGVTIVESVRVYGECAACGMDWDDDMDYCTGCESD